MATRSRTVNNKPANDGWSAMQNASSRGVRQSWLDDLHCHQPLCELLLKHKLLPLLFQLAATACLHVSATRPCPRVRLGLRHPPGIILHPLTGCAGIPPCPKLRALISKDRPPRYSRTARHRSTFHCVLWSKILPPLDTAARLATVFAICPWTIFRIAGRASCAQPLAFLG